MAAKTNPRPAKGVHTTKQRAQPPPPRWLLYLLAAIGVVGIALAVALLSFRGGSDTPSKETSAGLPDTPDYHSLLVDPSDPRELLLGTHVGLFVSDDGGQKWAFAALSNNDAMNLARPPGQTIWLAGHNVFKKSSDGGKTWGDLQPAGLPSLDIHGFAVDPRHPKTLYAAVAGQGLYRSRDGGRSFSLASQQVGGNVMALAALPDGRILAGDMQRGLLESRNGGLSWMQRLRVQLMGIAVNPSDPKRLLATGAGIALSTDGGRSWRSVLNLPSGAGPVAWSASEPKLAYAVGLDRNLYRSVDRGVTWHAVEGS
jgi:photosystem II stability/assembly factor-like uncharacterized protein